MGKDLYQGIASAMPLDWIDADGSSRWLSSAEPQRLKPFPDFRALTARLKARPDTNPGLPKSKRGLGNRKGRPDANAI